MSEEHEHGEMRPGASNEDDGYHVTQGEAARIAEKLDEEEPDPDAVRLAEKLVEEGP